MGSPFGFAKYAADHSRGFLGRKWVFAEIEQWLADHDGPRFFMIDGEPGIGKTAIASQLVQISKGLKDAPIGCSKVGKNFLSAYHFCISRQANTIDPHDFVKSLSKQLSTNEGFVQLILEEKGIHIDVHFDVRENYGELVGVYLENIFNENQSAISAFNRLVFDPIRELHKNEKESQVVILVDALDEAAQYEGSETVIDLLTNTARQSGNDIRFLITSRPDNAVLRHFEFLQIPSLDDDSNSRNKVDIRRLQLYSEKRENQQDVELYIHNYISKSKHLMSRFTSQENRLAFIERLLHASEGNFLYIAFLLNAIGQGDQEIDVKTLPRGLDGIYREFFRNREVGSAKNWKEEYRPILGILSVAQAPLSAEQIVQFTELDRQTVASGLRTVEQFLDPALFSNKSYQLFHQSIIDFLVDENKAQEFWIDLKRMHSQVASFFLKAWGGLAYSLPRLQEIEKLHLDTDYGIRYLTLHLELAEKAEELHELLTIHSEIDETIQNVWYHAKDAKNDIAGYLKDVQRAWYLAEKTYLKDKDPNSLILQIRYALLESTLHGQAGNVNSELLTLAVKYKVFSPLKAIHLAIQISKEDERSKAFAELSKILSSDQVNLIISEVREFQDEERKVHLLIKLIPILTEEQLELILQITELIEEEYHKWWVVREITKYIQHSEDLILVAYEIVKGIKDDIYRSLAYFDILPLLNDGQEKLIDIIIHELTYWVASQKGKSEYLGYLADIIPYCTAEVRNDLLQEIFSLIPEQEGSSILEETIIKISPFLGSERILQAMQIVRQITNLDDKSKAYKALIPVFPMELILEVWEETGFNNDSKYKAEIFTTLLPFLPSDLRRDKLIIILDTLRNITQPILRKGENDVFSPFKKLGIMYGIKHGWTQREVLEKIVPYFSEQQQLKDALNICWDINDVNSRFDTILILAPYLSAVLWNEVLQKVNLLDSCTHRIRIGTRYLKYMPNDIRNQFVLEMLEEATGLESENNWGSPQAEALITLLPHLPQELHEKYLKRVMDIIPTIRFKLAKVHLLIDILPEIESDLQKSLFVREAIDLAFVIEDEEQIALTILGLPLLTDVQYDQAVKIANRMDEGQRINILIKLLPMLPQALSDKYLDEIEESARQSTDKDLLVQLILFKIKSSEISESAVHINEALDLIPEIEVDVERMWRLLDIIPFLKNVDDSYDLYKKVLLVISSIQTEAFRPQLIHKLISIAPIEIIPYVINTAHEIKDEENYLNAFSGVLPFVMDYVTEDFPGQKLRDFFNLVREFYIEKSMANTEYRLNPDYLCRLMRFFTDDLIEDTFKLIEDLGRFIFAQDLRSELLIGLASHLDERQIQRALTLARSLVGDGLCVKVLSTTMPYLPDLLRAEVFDEALKRTRDIKWSDEDLAISISSLAPYLSKNLLKDALTIGSNISEQTSSSSQAQSEILYALIDYLPPELLNELLDLAWSRRDGNQRHRLLTKLKPRMPEIVKANWERSYLSLNYILHNASFFPRHEFLNTLRIIIPYIFCLVDSKDHIAVSKGIADSIIEVGTLWP